MNKKTLAFTFGSAIATALVINPVAHANENPFALKTITDASMLAEADTTSGSEKMKEGKCGEAKCGANKKMQGQSTSDMPSGEQKMKEGKCGEGKCGANKKMKEDTEEK